MRIVTITHEDCKWESSCLLSDNEAFSEVHEDALIQTMRDKFPDDMLTFTITDGITQEDL